MYIPHNTIAYNNADSNVASPRTQPTSTKDLNLDFSRDEISPISRQSRATTVVVHDMGESNVNYYLGSTKCDSVDIIDNELVWKAASRYIEYVEPESFLKDHSLSFLYNSKDMKLIESNLEIEILLMN